jgi:hypothetical protein
MIYYTELPAARLQAVAGASARVNAVARAKSLRKDTTAPLPHCSTLLHDTDIVSPAAGCRCNGAGQRREERQVVAQGHDHASHTQLLLKLLDCAPMYLLSLFRLWPARPPESTPRRAASRRARPRAAAPTATRRTRRRARRKRTTTTCTASSSVMTMRFISSIVSSIVV